MFESTEGIDFDAGGLQSIATGGQTNPATGNMDVKVDDDGNPIDANNNAIEAGDTTTPRVKDVSKNTVITGIEVKSITTINATAVPESIRQKRLRTQRSFLTDAWPPRRRRVAAAASARQNRAVVETAAHRRRNLSRRWSANTATSCATSRWRGAAPNQSGFSRARRVSAKREFQRLMCAGAPVRGHAQHVQRQR